MPALPKFQRIQTNDSDINRLQTNITKVVDTLSVQPLTIGNLLKSVVLVVGDNTIYHGLNAPLTGWIPTRIRAMATSLYDKQDTNSTPSQTLILNSSAAVTVDLFVF